MAATQPNKYTILPSSLEEGTRLLDELAKDDKTLKIGDVLEDKYGFEIRFTSERKFSDVSRFIMKNRKPDSYCMVAGRF